ncbi:MAG: glycoside hydrolase family 2 [Verrucomicrobia bacterium]|nr:glycoside hydrolase family 2 [Verrucomicrobiota bacterium]
MKLGKFIYLESFLLVVWLAFGMSTSAEGKSQEVPCTGTLLSLDGKQWFLGIDPKNVGRDQGWANTPPVDARSTRVPWVIQDVFPDYHGVAWYWRSFVAPVNPHKKGRYLLRFWAVDYKADVWVNGVSVGGHEGGETPFVLDVTTAIKPGTSNLIAVRVLNPGDERIDGITLQETPHRNKTSAFSSGADYNHGGIEDSVELFTAPAVRVQDMYVRANPATGIISVEANIRNALPSSNKGTVEFTMSPAAGGQTVVTKRVVTAIKSGDTLVKEQLKVENPRLWELNNPYLYRVTVKVQWRGMDGFDEQSARCGFRDFRFKNGHFRLNGRRILLRSSVSGNMSPIGIHVAYDPDWLRRDLINVKTMGFNAIRFYGLPTRHQLNLCDVLGLLVYEEPFSSQLYTDSPQMAARFDQSTSEMILRDRNHASVAIWGLLNETGDSPQFRHAVKTLSLVRSLDDSRMVLLSSGRFDGELSIGSLSNPGSPEWELLLGAERPGAPKTKPTPMPAYFEGVGDAHVYPWVPHTAPEIKFLRELGHDTQPVFVSEYGIASAVDLVRVTRHYEQRGAAASGEGRFYRQALDKFMVDWDRWKMAECFGRPEDYFAQSLKAMAGERLLGLNALRANPQLPGFSMTGTVDQGYTGEGLVTSFRELKPGTVDALFDALAPLRWCLFAEQVNVYRNAKVKLEAVLANEDVLAAGEYPVRFEVFGPNAEKVFSKAMNVRIAGGEAPFATPAFTEEVSANWPAGKYRFVATFERGGAAAGGEAVFHISEPVEKCELKTPVVLWGKDDVLQKWLAERHVEVREFDAAQQSGRELILVGSGVSQPGGAPAFKELAGRITRGSSAVFLDPNVFAAAGQLANLALIGQKGTLINLQNNVYHKDDWAKRHPIFADLPSGGLMDYTFYRELISNVGWSRPDAPTETVAGAVFAFTGYASGVLVSVDELGAGRVVLNTLRIRENLGKHPAADRLLANMLRFAEPDTTKGLEPVPDDFEARFKR